MKIYSINDPLVREAIYFGYRGVCFYTGRPVPKEMMEIDHLIPIAKGGSDSIDNYVLTCKKTNLSKQDKIESSLIERMQYIVKIAVAPRVVRKLEELKRKRKNTFRGKRPENLVCVRYKSLFWNGDRGIKILANSPLVTTENIYNILKVLDKYLIIAREHSITFCDDADLTSKFVKQIKSLWYEIDNRLIKLVEKAIPYEGNLPDKYSVYGTIHFNPKYISFIEELEADRKEPDDESEYDKYLGIMRQKYPPPEHLRKKWEEQEKLFSRI